MDFKVLPVKITANSSAVHCLFYKQHAVRAPAPDKPTERTLFVINIPPLVDEACMRRLFADCGKLQRVTFQKRPSQEPTPAQQSRFFPSAEPIRGYRVAYFVFSKPSSLQRALALNLTIDSAPRVLSTEEHPLLLGVIGWQQRYNDSVLDERALQKEVDEYMAEYDARVAEEARVAREKEGQPDEEGWVLVTRHGKRPVTRLTEGLDQRVKEKLKRKRQKQQTINLYNFQLKDSKMEQLAMFRQNFEEDKQKIAQLRLQRKFKPY